MFEFFYLILYMALSMLSGAVFGLIPFFVGKCMNKPGLGQLGWKWTMVAGLLFLQVPVAVGFVVAILVKEHDYYPRVTNQSYGGTVYSGAASGNGSSVLAVSCLSGPLKGRTYRIGSGGMTIGRDNGCTISFGANAPGVSRYHCSLKWNGSSLVLTDHNSSYGTYLSNGTKLPPEYPTPVAAGTRFYLGNTANLFGIVIQG